MDITNTFDLSKLPPRSQVGVLAPEISDEGQRVIYSDGESVNWTPPPAIPVIPDFSRIKSLQRYFGRSGHQVYPAYVYHATETARIVKNRDEGIALGIWYREATIEERGKYGVKGVWDWAPDSPWRPHPWPGALKFDPLKAGIGKEYIRSPANPIVAQNALLEAVIPQVTAAVVQALRASGPAAPANIKASDWEEFQAFLAFKKTTEAVAAIADEEDAGAETGPAVATEDLAAEREALISEATIRGVRVDRRWSAERLRNEIAKST